jgi:cobyrinic acid a,c-diamide synthase
VPAPESAAAEPAAPQVTIGVFRDAAFQFYYPENLEALVRAGARLVEVSPLADASLPDVQGLYVGGGFPETFASGLADNVAFRESLRRALAAGLPAYAECGGAVYLGESLHYRSNCYPMAGALPATYAFQDRPRGHGYALLETVAENPYFAVGREVRAHEFHHTYLHPATTADLNFVFNVRRGHGFDGARDGLCVGNVLATYAHVHALGTPDWAPSMVRAAAGFAAAPRRLAGVGT